MVLKTIVSINLFKGIIDGAVSDDDDDDVLMDLTYYTEG